MHNEQFNKINSSTYFSGAFLHRNVFMEGNLSINPYILGESFELEDAAKIYYDLSSDPLPQGELGDLKFDSHFESGNLFAAFKVSIVVVRWESISMI